MLKLAKNHVPIVAFVVLPLGASTAAAQSGVTSFAKLDSIAGAGVLANRAVGLVAAVVKGTDTLLMQAYGRADVEWDVPMSVDAMFEVGSIAKQFTAAAVLQLRDAGKLSLDDEITTWLPEQYTWVFAPGAICSTAGDLVTWLQALHSGKVLSTESYAEMTTPSTLADGATLQYGMGIKVGEDRRGLRYIGHGGTAPGFRADATWYPDAQMAVVVLTNTSPASLSPGSVGGELARAVLPWPRPAMKYYTGDPAPFVGTYRHVVGGSRRSFIIDVTQAPTGLAFWLNGSRPQVLPWAGGLKFYASENVTLTFRRANGDTGPVTELRRDDAGNHYILRKQENADSAGSVPFLHGVSIGGRR